MEKTKLLLATTNAGKLKDFNKILSQLGVPLQSVKNEIEETGKTFEENAVLKARACAKNGGLPCVADDGGIEIDALNGEPGVMSRRWPGYKASDEELINYALERMHNAPKGKRSARFRSVVAFADPEGNVVTEERSTEGEITFEASIRRITGYPYRSIFWLPVLKKYAVELTEEEEERISHRQHAIEALLPIIQNYFKKI